MRIAGDSWWAKPAAGMPIAIRLLWLRLHSIGTLVLGFILVALTTGAIALDIWLVIMAMRSPPDESQPDLLSTLLLLAVVIMVPLLLAGAAGHTFGIRARVRRRGAALRGSHDSIPP